MPVRPVQYGSKRAPVAEEPRQRLIVAGLDLFGKYSFEGASTRMLSQQAQVNLAAITYYSAENRTLPRCCGPYNEQINGLLEISLRKSRKPSR